MGSTTLLKLAFLGDKRTNPERDIAVGVHDKDNNNNIQRKVSRDRQSYTQSHDKQAARMKRFHERTVVKRETLVPSKGESALSGRLYIVREREAVFGIKLSSVQMLFLLSPTLRRWKSGSFPLSTCCSVVSPCIFMPPLLLSGRGARGRR